MNDLLQTGPDFQRAYLEAFPDGPDAPRLFLSLADLYAKQGQTAKQLKQLEDYQRKYAKDPDEWLGLQAQIAQLYEKAGNAPMARRVQAQGLEYWRRNRDRGGSHRGRCGQGDGCRHFRHRHQPVLLREGKAGRGQGRHHEAAWGDREHHRAG